MKPYFLFFLFALSLLSCSSDDEYFGASQTRTLYLDSQKSYTQINNFELSGGGKYKTLMVTPAEGWFVGENDPFPFRESDEDASVFVIIADASRINLRPGWSFFSFPETGLFSDIEFFNIATQQFELPWAFIGDEIAIWGSEEEYTNEDLRAHEGDVEYFTKVSRSFVCRHITTLENRDMYVVYNNGVWYD